jgi:hypothetical protein
VNVDGALAALGLAGQPDWATVRRAYRTRISGHHPDVGGRSIDAAQINDAYRILRDATCEGTVAIPLATERPKPAITSSTQPPVDPEELLLVLADAAHTVGHLVFVDPQAGILEVVVGEPPGSGQLTATIGERTAEGIPVSFTLEPLGSEPCEPIQHVVNRLMQDLPHQQRSEFLVQTEEDQSR